MSKRARELGFRTVSLHEDVIDALDAIAPLLGFYGVHNRQKVIAHLLSMAEERPDFFHVANRKRKYPPIDRRFHSPTDATT